MYSKTKKIYFSLQNTLYFPKKLGKKIVQVHGGAGPGRADCKTEVCIMCRGKSVSLVRC